MRRVGEMLSRNPDTILTFARYRMTNGAAESLNSKRMACGYWNREYFKVVIAFFCGRLDRYSRQA